LSNDILTALALLKHLRLKIEFTCNFFVAMKYAQKRSAGQLLQMILKKKLGTINAKNCLAIKIVVKTP
jgi:hypothetical protein